jgi:hypothetical protein
LEKIPFHKVIGIMSSSDVLLSNLFNPSLQGCKQHCIFTFVSLHFLFHSFVHRIGSFPIYSFMRIHARRLRRAPMSFVGLISYDDRINFTSSVLRDKLDKKMVCLSLQSLAAFCARLADDTFITIIYLATRWDTIVQYGSAFDTFHMDTVTD